MSLVRSVPACLALLASAPAAAQSLTVSLGSSDIVKNGGDCGDTVSGTWSSSSLSSVCSALRVWLTTSGSCADAPGDSDVTVTTVSQGDLGSSASGSFSFKISKLPAFGDAGCGAAVDSTVSVCASVERQSSGGSCDSWVVSNRATLRYDAEPPGPPELSIVPLDGKLSVSLAPSSSDDSDDVTRYFVDLAEDPGDGGVPSWRNVGGEVSGRTTVRGLTNGVRYLVRGIAIDEAENRGEPSEPIVATPVASDGLLARYAAAGGSEQGCGAAGLLPLGPALLGLRRRRRA